MKQACILFAFIYFKVKHLGLLNARIKNLVAYYLGVQIFIKHNGQNSFSKIYRAKSILTSPPTATPASANFSMGSVYHFLTPKQLFAVKFNVHLYAKSHKYGFYEV